jgi:hypothetical protein
MKRLEFNKLRSDNSLIQRKGEPRALVVSTGVSTTSPTADGHGIAARCRSSPHQAPQLRPSSRSGSSSRAILGEFQALVVEIAFGDRTFALR